MQMRADELAALLNEARRQLRDAVDDLNRFKAESAQHLREAHASLKQASNLASDRFRLAETQAWRSSQPPIPKLPDKGCAEHTRAFAEEVKDAVVRHRLLKLAERFEHSAETLSRQCAAARPHDSGT